MQKGSLRTAEKYTTPRDYSEISTNNELNIYKYLPKN